MFTDIEATFGLPFFDPYRIAASHAMRTIVADAVDHSLAVERLQGLRQRARSLRDSLTYNGTVEALLCSLIHAHLTGHRGIRMSLDKRVLAAKRTRYNASGLLTEQLPVIVKLLAKHFRYFTLILGEHTPFGGKQTELHIHPWFIERLQRDRIGLYDLDRREGEELVLLKGTKDSLINAALEDYTDNDHTAQLRADVRRINRYLASADIECSDDDSGRVVDDRQRHLRRHFTRGCFDSGGRLFGGFWLKGMSKKKRLSRITLNGEAVASLDFKSMQAQIAYAHVGKPAPEGDAYPLDHMNAQGKAVRLNRDTVKKLFAAALFYDKPLRAWPKDLQMYSGGLSVSTVMKGIVAAHPDIAHLFFRGLGHRFMFTESQIVMSVMHQLIALDIPALPVHDCVVIPKSAATTAEEIMRDTFAALTGGKAHVVIESASAQ